MTSRNASVDIGKFIAAIFVIGIHTRPLSGLSPFFDFALTDILFRTAVPFFAVCTGYYLAKKINTGDRVSSRTTVKIMAIRVLLLYVGWSLFFLLLLSLSWFKTGLLSVGSYVGWFKSFLLGQSYYHLWYLAQLFWALLLFYPIVMYAGKGWMIALIVLLWLTGAFVYVYSDILGVGHQFVRLFDTFGAITGSTVRMLPLLLTGALIAQSKPAEKRRFLIGTVFFFMLIVIEAFALKDAGAQRFSYIVCTLPLAYCLFSLVEHIPCMTGWNTRIISKASMNIYLIHPAVLFLCGLLHIDSPFILFLVTALVSCFLCVSFEMLKKKSNYIC